MLHKVALSIFMRQKYLFPFEFELPRKQPCYLAVYQWWPDKGWFLFTNDDQIKVDSYQTLVTQGPGISRTPNAQMADTKCQHSLPSFCHFQMSFFFSLFFFYKLGHVSESLSFFLILCIWYQQWCFNTPSGGTQNAMHLKIKTSACKTYQFVCSEHCISDPLSEDHVTLAWLS